MKPPVGGMSHKELHGSGHALNAGGPGERTHAMHSPAPAPSAESGGGVKRESPGILNDKQMAREEGQKAAHAAGDFSSADAPGNAGAGDRDVLAAGKGYFGAHGAGTELEKSGYDTDEYAASHAVSTGNMAGQRKP